MQLLDLILAVGLSDVCCHSRTVQEIVQGAMRPLQLNLIPVSLEDGNVTKGPFCKRHR